MISDFEITLPLSLAALGPVDVALILGSGLSDLAEGIEQPTVVPFADIPGFPRADKDVAGHRGRLVVGTLGGKRVAVFQGRIHCYQGFSAREVSFPVRLANAMGACTLFVTNAAGGVSAELTAGDIVLISDHVNLMGDNPLKGWAGPADGFPFVAMRDAYDPELRAIAIECSKETGVPLVPEGVYFGLSGPSYETPAEIAMVRTLGADVVGMSTVPEVIAARALGMRVLGLSLVTNTGAEVGLSHAEVLETGRRASEYLRVLALAILLRLP